MTHVFAVLAGLVLGVGLLLIGARLAGFVAQRPADYATGGPPFDIRTALAGPILCEGMIYGPLGRVTSRFVARMDGVWQGDTGVMAEHFTYDSGLTQDREWRLSLNPDGTIRAEADDLVGPGRGVQMGNAVQLQYRIRLPDSAGGHVLDVTDWMYLLENGTVMNRSQFRKFGIKVAELVATMRKLPA